MNFGQKGDIHKLPVNLLPVRHKSLLVCTVTYLPLESGYILTSSRDEQPGRPTSDKPCTRQIGNQTVLYPQDIRAGGTWIAVAARASVCLLNGAFAAHKPEPPYRHSRGLLVTGYFTFETTGHFLAHYTFEGLEPFTLLIVEEYQLLEIRWDGSTLFRVKKDKTKPQIWSSATLYSPEIMAKREKWFGGWVEQRNGAYSESAARHFHLTAGEGDQKNDIFMHRALVQTVSLTSIVREAWRTQLWYQSFNKEQVQNQIHICDLPVRLPAAVTNG